MEKQRVKAKEKKREDLLHAEEQHKEKKCRIIFPITYHPVNTEVCKVVKHHYKTLSKDQEIGRIFKEPPMIAFRRDRNLKDILVRSTLSLNKKYVGMQSCGRNRCLTCSYINKDKVVIGPKGSFAVNEQFSCTSSGLVYCIICKRCGDLYVGETGRRLADRFTEHRRDVISNKTEKEVASHFNSPGHNGTEDMSVLGLQSANDLIKRKL